MSATRFRLGFLPRSLRLQAFFSRQFVSPPAFDDFMVGNAANYVDEMYAVWLKDPGSVHASWQAYFSNMKNGLPPEQAFVLPPTLSPRRRNIDAIPPTKILSSASQAVHVVDSPAKPSQEIRDHLKVQLLVRAYQVRGHLKAKLDPLGIMQPSRDFCPAPELEPSYYGFTAADMDRMFQLGEGMLPQFTSAKPRMTLREIVDQLQKTYCGCIGYEYSHISDRTQCDWIRARVEVPKPYEFGTDQKRVILDRMIWADSFEKFVATKYPAEKRFGLEGGEALIPGMKAMIDRSVEHGVENIVIGMSHRGRLNVLSNVVRKPNESIFSEFLGVMDQFSESSGDVRYHLGMNYDCPTPSGKRVQLSLVANPSHLEAADPVVEGKVRALQFYLKDDKTHEKAMAVLLHGDAAFAAQGVVYETLGMSSLPSYQTGGTIHLIINNQIGFTTDPRFARSTPYCSDLAKSIDAPIFHVNADDLEAVVHVCQLASDWRKQFKTDVVIDLVCYRRHGHNEVDQPSFTQPRMYHAIQSQPSALDIYAKRILGEGFSKEELDANRKRVWDLLEQSYAASKTYKPTTKEWLTSAWNGFKSPKEISEEICPSQPTGVSEETLRHVGNVVSSCPGDFALHRGLVRILEARKKTIESSSDVDMPTAEAMAFGTLLLEGNHVRVSGQDVERGTFSQRHAVLHDQVNENTYIPLEHLSPTQAPFTICNSSLSEYGCLGFELGYSLVSPRSLICWEAQFGDFANNAQCIIDQFISSGERKWLQRSGLTLLLPHGYDGAGPEHSNARIERFLSLCDDDPYKMPETDEARLRQAQDCNIQVVYPTTPANYFHALRRQVHRDFRKPLILLTSKSLLRHPAARSSFAEMNDDTRMLRLIPDPATHLLSQDKIKSLIFCSGQVYYALAKARDVNKLYDMAIIRIEQLSPFPFDLVCRIADQYPNASLVWCQEEAMNLGPWSYVEPRIESAMKITRHHSRKRARYAGRDPTAAVATGYKKLHIAQEHGLLSEALLGHRQKPKNVETGVPVWHAWAAHFETLMSTPNRRSAEPPTTNPYQNPHGPSLLSSDSEVDTPPTRVASDPWGAPPASVRKPRRSFANVTADSWESPPTAPEEAPVATQTPSPVASTPKPFFPPEVLTSPEHPLPIFQTTATPQRDPWAASPKTDLEMRDFTNQDWATAPVETTPDRDEPLTNMPTHNEDEEGEISGGSPPPLPPSAPPKQDKKTIDGKPLTIMRQSIHALIEVLMVPLLLLLPSFLLYQFAWFPSYDIFRNKDLFRANPCMEFMRWSVFLAIASATYILVEWLTGVLPGAVIIVAKKLKAPVHAKTKSSLRCLQAIKTFVTVPVVLVVIIVLAGQMLYHSTITQTNGIPSNKAYDLEATFLVCFVFAASVAFEKMAVEAIAHGFHRIALSERVKRCNARFAVLSKLYRSTIQRRPIGHGHNASPENDTNLMHDTFADLTSRSRAKAIADAIYLTLKQPNRHYLVASDIRDAFPPSQYEEAFNMFDANRSGKVTRAMMRAAVVAIYVERDNVAKSLISNGRIVRKLDIMLLVATLIICIWLTFSAYHPQTYLFLTSTATTMLVLGFMFKDTGKRIFECLLFVFAEHAFDVGDKIRIDNETMTVENIEIFTTRLLRSDGLWTYISNSVLAGKSIFNERRGPFQTDQVEVFVASDVPAARLEEIRKHIAQHLRDNQKEFAGIVTVKTVEMFRQQGKQKVRIESRNFDLRDGEISEGQIVVRRNKLTAYLNEVLARLEIPILHE